ncbi:hypothetical protein PSHT_11230, partial [Puccinia striiformis]
DRPHLVDRSHLPLDHFPLNISPPQPTTTASFFTNTILRSMAPPAGQHLAAIDLQSAQHFTPISRKIGVPGDGFHEGIERTREHRRASALAQLTQLAAAAHTASLSDAEAKILGDADRYGFFKSKPSERVLYLPSDAFYPIAVAPPSDSIQSITPPALNTTNHELLAKEASRIEKWTDMLIPTSRDPSSYQSCYQLKPEWNQQRARFEKRCFKGIQIDGERCLGNALAESDTQPTTSTINGLLISPSEQDVQIDLDVPRTINGHIFFHTRYGKGYIILPQYASPQNRHSIRYASFFINQTARTFPGTPRIWNVLSNVWILPRHGPNSSNTFEMPSFVWSEYMIIIIFTTYLLPAFLDFWNVFTFKNVYATFDKQMVGSSAYSTKWYITIFANTVSYEAQLRLWDAFFLKGMDILILAAVSLVYALRSKIGPGHDFEQILSTLGGRFEMEDSFRWLRSIRKLYNRQDIQDLIHESRTQWASYVLDGSASKRVT